ncbi:BTB/POZ protein [Terfezia claveryi]|uniref:Elongin-C n=1 Tax=Terfezia boudieri ATCC MYA-4762 TaxID=1051890 RepID=A0A3N4LAR2_9PEZI|nr:BTB/POZ protein [Terfezia claveryi]RPB18562.1 POZ domain-containing protein [Terfezia boudieri ATCC MYA-4762]
MSDVDQEYVILESNDGFQFVLRKSAAKVSKAIKSMLDKKSNFTEARENKIVFKNMNGIVLEKVCEYFYYNEKYKGQTNVPEMELPAELAFSLLEVADYLET